MASARVGWLVIVLAAGSLDIVRLSGADSPAADPQSTRPAPAVSEPTASLPPSNVDRQSPRATLDKYCVTCHSDRRQTAGIVLEGINVDRVGDEGDTWERVLRKLRAETMPPPGLPRPDAATYRTLASWLETELDRAAAANPNPGSVPVHRLNRAEYANAIRDLLGLEVDGRALLTADDVDPHGFDNIAGVLSISPVLLDRYMSAARKISRLAIGNPAVVPGWETFTAPKLLFQETRMGDDFPFGSRGGIGVEYYFPLDAEYVVKVRLRRQLYDYILGLAEPHVLDVRLDGVRLKQFTVGGEVQSRQAPATYAGEIRGDVEWEKYLSTADDTLEVRFNASAGRRVVSVSFVQESVEPDGVLQPRTTGRGFFLDENYDGNPAVESLAVGGPYEPTGPGESLSRRTIFTCRPETTRDEEPCARRILSRLARRAYRRPVTSDDVEILMSFYKEGRAAEGFDIGIERALTRVLVDPEFLFRIERTPAKVPHNGIYRITDLELASRLSFFLWSSIPDEELLDAATRGQLGDPKVLERQVRRMLADRRAHALVENFASQWLTLRGLRTVIPDPDVFPAFDDNLREALERETELFVESQLRGDHSVLDLLRADYTFVNERLARHYDIPNVYGDHFRRVAVDPSRAGLLGQGSILTVTSYGNRTSPVLRGKWLLDNILGAPPPPPPPDVPSLKDRGEDGQPQSVRERMEVHRRNPACAVCHVHMDPLGFALENFDAIGKWRTTSEAGTPIDPSSTLPDGKHLDGVRGLQNFLLNQPEEIVRTVAEKLLIYAVGRSVEYYDLPTVRKIIRSSAADDYRWSSIILGIVNSSPFQMRRAES